MIINAYTYGDATHQDSPYTFWYVIEAIDTDGHRYAGVDGFNVAIWSDEAIPGAGVPLHTNGTIAGDHDATGSSYEGSNQGLHVGGVSSGGPGFITVHAGMTYFDFDGTSTVFTWDPPGTSGVFSISPEPPPVLTGYLTLVDSGPYVAFDFAWEETFSKDSRYDQIYYLVQWNYSGTWENINPTAWGDPAPSLSGGDTMTQRRAIHLPGPYAISTPVGFRVTAREPWIGGPSFPSNELWSSEMSFGPPGPTTTRASWGVLAR